MRVNSKKLFNLLKSFFNFSYWFYSCLRLTCQDFTQKRQGRVCLFVWLLYGLLSVPPFFFLAVSSFPSLTFFLCYCYHCCSFRSFVSFQCLFYFSFSYFLSEPFFFFSSKTVPCRNRKWNKEDGYKHKKCQHPLSLPQSCVFWTTALSPEFENLRNILRRWAREMHLPNFFRKAKLYKESHCH